MGKLREAYGRSIANPRRWRGLVQDRPWSFNILLSVLVVLHSMAAWFLGWANPWWSMQSDAAVAQSFSSLLASASAVTAGFSGVVVMFGLQVNTPRIQRFRRRGGKALVANWTSATGLAFIALAASIAAFLSATWAFRFGVIFFSELALITLLHATCRVTWVFRVLIDGVSAEDQVAEREEKMAKPSRLVIGGGGRRGRG